MGNQDQYDRVVEIFNNCPSFEKIIAFDSRIQLNHKDSIYFDEFLEIGKKSSHDVEVKKRIESIE